jgi:hypothetical protein
MGSKLLIRRLSSSPYCKIFILYIGWRLAILLVFYLALSLFQPAGTPSPHLTVWTAHMNGDGAAYLRIAEFGYKGACSMGGNIMALRLFPLYPLLVRGLSYLTFGNYLAASILVNFISTLIMLFCLWKLLLMDEEESKAYRTIIYLLVFPGAVFLAAAYSEALFLLTLVASVYEARRGRWLGAGIWGMLCALTRPAGVLVALVIAWEYLKQRGFAFRQIRADAFSLLLIPLGSFFYMGYLWSAYGDPLIFTQAQEIAHQREFSIMIYRPVVRAVRVIANRPFLDSMNAITILNLSLLVLFICLAFYGIFKLRSTYTVLLAVFLLAILALDSHTYPLVGMCRYVLPLFPAFLLLARAGDRETFNGLYMVFSTLLLGVLTAVFALGIFFIA